MVFVGSVVTSAKLVSRRRIDVGIVIPLRASIQDERDDIAKIAADSIAVSAQIIEALSKLQNAIALLPRSNDRDTLIETTKRLRRAIGYAQSAIHARMSEESPHLAG